MWDKIVKASEVFILSALAFIGVYFMSILIYCFALGIICPANMNDAPLWPVAIITAVLMIPTEVLIIYTFINVFWACEKKGK